MASNEKSEANRENAKKSTGPKTELGKTKTRSNALKHGVFALQRVLLGEDETAYANLVSRMMHETAPRAAIERMLVDQIIGDMWRLQRLERAELAYFEQLRKSTMMRAAATPIKNEGEETRLRLDDETDPDKASIAAELAKRGLTFVRTMPSEVSENPQTRGEESKSFRDDDMRESEEEPELERARDLSDLLLDGMTAPDKQFATLDQIRRSLVREIVRKYSNLVGFQDRRRTLTAPRANSSKARFTVEEHD